MKKFACVFPGQGSQYVGMGKEIASISKEGDEIFKLADRTLGIKISDICWDGPEDELVKTVNTQPAIVTTSIAAYAVLREKGLNPSVVAGHSIGEYSALVAAGAISFEDAISLVRKRGQLMYEAGIKNPGAMSAIIGLDYTKMEEICKEVSAFGICQIANLNSADQLVISGNSEAVAKAGEAATKEGAKKVIQLKVSGAFHSPLMASAAEELKRDIEKIEIRDPKIPVVTNVYAKEATTAGEIKEALILQMENRVLWKNTIEFIKEKGLDLFVEVGSGKVLAGLNRKINKEIKTINLEDKKTLEKFLNFFDLKTSV